MQFAIEDWWTSDLYSFPTGEPAVYNIDALEESEVLLLDKASQENAPLPSQDSIGLYHTAFEVSDKKSFALAYKSLAEAGVSAHPIDHFISWALYFSDPDGNGLKIYVDTRKDSQGRESWHGQSQPLEREKILTFLNN